jgi:tetratricopeptide (TPR) repeat protein
LPSGDPADTPVEDVPCPVCSSGMVDPPPPRAALPAAEALADLLGAPATQPQPPTPRAAPPAPLPSVPGYEILEELGRGGMGIVYKARQTSLKRLVALKMILAGPHAGPEALARFRAEAEAAARLQHPNIVQIYEVGEHDGRPFLALEIVEGGSLDRALAGTPLPARPAAEMVQTLARAMHAAHQVGIIHRDLKPANVLLGGDRQPKISDFGLAKHLDSDVSRTQSGAVLGTPSYMAPEQAAGKGKGEAVGPAVDTYALGAILYELLTGRPPFRAATVLATLEQVRSREPVAPSRLQPGLPRDLQTICLKCLHKEPARRYASALEMAEDLGRFLRAEPIRARPVAWHERLAKWTRRKPALAALIAVTVLSLVGAVCGGLVYNARLRATAERAQQQRQRADARYQAARQALYRMLGRLEELQLAQVPRFRELERAQFEDALAFYQEVLQGEDLDPVILGDAAVAYERLATSEQILGQGKEAEENYRRAVELRLRLPAEVRDAPDQQDRLAGCYNNLGLMTGGTGRWDEAERYYREALGISERLASALPKEQRWQSGISQCEHNLGDMYLHSGRSAEAEPHYNRAVAINTALLREHPDDEHVQAALAADHVDLGLVLQGSGRTAEAIQGYEKAEGLLRPLVQRHPPGGDYALSLAAAYANWGANLRDAGRLQAALPWQNQAASLFEAAVARHTQAVELGEAVLQQEPQHAIAREQTLNAYGARAQDYEVMGRWADAVKDWDCVVALEEPPKRWVHRIVRAQDLARAGDHVRAAAEAQELEADPKVGADGLCNLAVVYACALGPARSAAGLTPAERDALAERYGSQAVVLLAKLQAQGYFREASRSWALKNDPDLQPLRRRADFQNLLGQLNQK